MIPLCKSCNSKPITYGMSSCRCPSLCIDCAENSLNTCCIICKKQGIAPVKLRRHSILEPSLSVGKCLLCFDKGIDSRAEFGGVQCRCLTLCKSCALKIATGGKCPKCDAFFMGVARVH